MNFLEDCISTCVPDDPDTNLTVPSSVHHLCSVWGINRGCRAQASFAEHTKDLHHLAEQCQHHSHRSTCYKYCKSSEKKECQFDLDEHHCLSESVVDPDTGEIDVRQLDGMVNNFNKTILATIRCNMDIKFIGSGESAKAILYYITDYISKAQLKAHVAYAALEMAVRKLGEYNPLDDELTIRAKRMLQKCAHSMIAHQELSIVEHWLNAVCINSYHDIACLIPCTLQKNGQTSTVSPTWLSVLIRG